MTTAERRRVKIHWPSFRRGFYDGFTGGPLWRAIGRVWKRLERQIAAAVRRLKGEQG